MLSLLRSIIISRPYPQARSFEFEFRNRPSWLKNLTFTIWIAAGQPNFISVPFSNLRNMSRNILFRLYSPWRAFSSMIGQSLQVTKRVNFTLGVCNYQLKGNRSFFLRKCIVHIKYIGRQHETKKIKTKISPSSKYDIWYMLMWSKSEICEEASKVWRGSIIQRIGACP